MKSWLGGLLLCLVLNGCVVLPIGNRIHGLTPTDPKPQWFLRDVSSVDEHAPLLRWEPTQLEDMYDLIIYEVDDQDLVGREVYYRERITKPEHRVEIQLERNTDYYWSIRVHREDHRTEWSRSDTGFCFAGLVGFVFVVAPTMGCKFMDHPFFRFTTSRRWF